MTKIFTKYTLIISITTFLFSACELISGDSDDDNSNTTVDKLHVKFINTEGSEFTISSIQILVMGVAGELNGPDGEFSDNILSEGTTIAPGNHYIFDFEIPNSYYSYARLGVINSENNQIILNEQEGYTNQYEGTITHWGGDDRTVNVTLIENKTTGLIMVRSWGEWAGIE